MLLPARFELFYRRPDPTDPRLGQVVERSVKSNVYPQDLADFAATLVGFPDDQGIALNKGRTGAALGPDKIREHLYKLTPGSDGALAKIRVCDVGNVSILPNIEESHRRAAAALGAALAAGAVPISLGGGNDYAYAEADALCAHVPAKKKIGIINVDAHLDVRNLNFGITSGTPYYRVLRDHGRRIPRGAFVEFGTQPAKNAGDHAKFVREHGGSVLTLAQTRQPGVAANFKKVLRAAAKKCHAVMVSLDMDAVRQADAPGVSAPSPDGLSAAELLAIARVAGAEKRVAMFSIYEVSPPHDRDDQTARLAAQCVWEFLAGLAGR